MNLSCYRFWPLKVLVMYQLYSIKEITSPFKTPPIVVQITLEFKLGQIKIKQSMLDFLIHVKIQREGDPTTIGCHLQHSPFPMQFDVSHSQYLFWVMALDFQQLCVRVLLACYIKKGPSVVEDITCFGSPLNVPFIVLQYQVMVLFARSRWSIIKTFTLVFTNITMLNNTHSQHPWGQVNLL